MGIAELTLLFLLFMWALLLFGGFVIGKTNEEGTHRTSTNARMLSSLALVFSAWWIQFTINDTFFNTYALLIALGMTLGFVGDLFMARLLMKGDNHVLGGIGAFSIGHIFYILAGVEVAGKLSEVDPNFWMMSFGFWYLVGLIGWFAVVFFRSERTVMHFAALPYTLLLASTAAVFTALALQFSVFVLVAVGAVLFLLSDLLLAAQLFKGAHFRFIGDVVWFMYGPGQMLIVFGVVIAGLLGI